jgi:hypothetical protein
MPSLMKKLTTLARSERGTTAVAKVREQVAKPENRARLDKLKGRIGRKP